MTVLADAVDRALEAAVAPSFTRIGCLARSRLDHWSKLDNYDLSGRVVVITGATSGLGLAAARALGADGAGVVIVARNEAKARAVRKNLRRTAPGGVEVVVADTGDLDAVRRAGAEIAERHAQVDALIHAAGALDETYTVSPQGIEQTVASQVVGPFALTELLVPLLRAAPAGRVVWVSSGGMYAEPLSVDNLEMDPGNYNGTRAYARAKRAQVTLAELWADRLRADDIVVHSMHPGWADTPGVRRSLPTFRRVVGPAAPHACRRRGHDRLACCRRRGSVETTGLFWHDRRPRPVHRLASTRRSDTPAERQRLWDWCLDRTSRSTGQR